MWPYLLRQHRGVRPTRRVAHEPGERPARTLTAARAEIAAAARLSARRTHLHLGWHRGRQSRDQGDRARRPREADTSSSQPIEHEAVRESCDYLRRLHGFEIEVLPVDAEGRVDPATLADAHPRRHDARLDHVREQRDRHRAADRRTRRRRARRGRTRMHIDAVQSARWFDVARALWASTPSASRGTSSAPRRGRCAAGARAVFRSSP